MKIQKAKMMPILLILAVAIVNSKIIFKIADLLRALKTFFYLLAFFLLSETFLNLVDILGKI